MANLKVTLVKSTIGAVPKHKKTVEALGLKKVNKTVELPDNAATRGMVKQVQHLVKSESDISQNIFVFYISISVLKIWIPSIWKQCAMFATHIRSQRKCHI